MPITNVQFGSNLRPSTVDVMNKLNEVIDVVNTLSSSDHSSDIKALQTRVTNVETTASANSTAIGTLQTTVGDHSTDLTQIKNTLYTPLASNENA